jgi:nucleoside-diphosphate-sugar epimerase
MVVVTGGTGLLGSHLLAELSKGDKIIRAIYRDEQRIEHVKKVFSFYYGPTYESQFNRIQWIQGDILDVPSLEEAFEGAETVYHCAGFVSFARRDFFRCMKINREGTANVVNVCLSAGVKTLCHVSSTAALNGKQYELNTEDTGWRQTGTGSGYAISKYSAEKEVWRGVEEGLNCVIVNPCLIFGSGSWEESSLTIFRTISKGLRFYTSGSNAIVDARDVAEIMVRLANSSIRNERFLCTGENITFRELMTKIALRLDKRPPTISTPRFLLGLVWRAAALIALFRGKSPTINRETARNAFSNMSFDNSKIRGMLNFNFRNADEMIDNTVRGRLD